MEEPLSTEEILEMLKLPIADISAVRLKLQGNASARALAGALDRADTSELRGFLCEMLGKRRPVEEVPSLLKCLDDPAAQTRYAAADALASSHEPSTGPKLLARFAV